ncbi:MAG: Phenylalanine--tRNA ligase beta subunit [Planctomycetes bacterium ADurb.Bin412]|nr:MAG: Phenylalanine--tRNA ligase beta subunit [Planctomycetes bacterium ADurb.Bin412]
MRLPDVNFPEVGKPVMEWTSVVDEAPRYCSRYTARLIMDVKVGPSPDWMRRRLETIGQRAINNVVDITNYVMMEIGQPLHSFDYDLLKEGRIVVRMARPGEQMVSIDHSVLELKENMLVIADAKKAVAIAGIMGGLESEVVDTTKNILLESAHFDPLSIRRTSRELTLASEASFRFERNIDPVMLEWASRRATALLVQLAGGKAAPGLVDAWPVKKQTPPVQMRLSRMRHLLGISIETERVLTILDRLGFGPQHDHQDLITCQIPSWRGDVQREVDLIEEVIRIQGYGHIPAESSIHITVKTEDKYQRTRKKVVNAVQSCGYYETVNVGFLEDKYWPPFCEAGFEPVRVKDVSRKNKNALRASLLPSLLEVRKRNQDAGNEDCRFFELAAVHRPARDRESLPIETIQLGLLTDGSFQDLRGAIESIVASLDNQQQVVCQPGKVIWAREDAAADLYLGTQKIGQMGVAAENILALFDLSREVCLAELSFAELLKLEGRTVTLQPLIRFPGIVRDLSLVLDEEVPWIKLEQAIRAQQIEDMRELRFVDIYRGKGIDAGKKSLTLSMEFRSVNETLTHEQADAYQEKILSALYKEFDAKLRA